MADKNFLTNIFIKSLVGIKKLGLEVVNERGYEGGGGRLIRGLKREDMSSSQKG